MAEETLDHVSTMIDRQSVDTTAWFDRLWQMNSSLFERVQARFAIERDPSSLPFDRYSSEVGPQGHMTTWSGPEVDWAVFSNIGNPSIGFSNMHLTVWLGPDSKVPHLAMAFGTMPMFFFLVDYMPRADVSIDTDYLMRYYQPLNATWLERRAHPELHPFTSRALYVRQVLSETAFCYTAACNDDNFSLLEDIASTELTRWLSWVDTGDVAPAGEQAALARRDVELRRNSAELDPANELAVRYFGEERHSQLVRQLWGGDRVSKRPGGHANSSIRPVKSVPKE